MKPKEYLVSVGKLPPGSENKKGRLSLANIELCKAAAGKGVSIDGYAVSTSTATPTAPAAKVVTKEKVTTEKQIIEPAPFHYPEALYDAFEVVSGKSRSLREACRLCRCSLVGCWCPTPEIVATDASGNVAVRIVRNSVVEADN